MVVVVEGVLLQTKLHAPRRRRRLVARPVLSGRVSRGVESALTLVSAPAGFGKTTLLTEWLASAPADGSSTAWLSLDERDNDPAVFWAYLVAALQMATAGVGARALALLQSPQPSIEAVLAVLVNDLHAVSHDVVLVLDDYHVIDAPDVHDGMAFLLEHLPPQLHLVIATRADPAFPLARFRGRGELVEVRVADLRFSADEAAAYLNEVMGLALTAGDVAALEGRTEGWIAALQLAALSMQGRDDVSDFIAGFAGDDRYIVDYLIEEVLARQAEDVRRFLMQTSILRRLSGALCDAVTGQSGGRAMLEALDRENLFLVPLDDRRQWYRYHHLFADVLRARLVDEQPDRLRELHSLAREWHEHQGERSEAIHHALAGEDFERAADLVELAIPTLRRDREEATMRRWLEALPEEVVAVRPVLIVGCVGSLMGRGEVEGVEAHLRAAEQWLDTPRGVGASPHAPTPMVVVDEDGFRALPSAIAMYRAGLAHLLGDVAGTMAHARRALDLVGEGDRIGHGSAAALLGLAYWTSGDLDAAYRWYADGMASLVAGGLRSFVIGGAPVLADIRIAQGRLGEAMQIYERALQRANSQELGLQGAADMHVGMSELCRERDDLAAAMQHLVASRELGEHAGLAQNRYRWRVAMARMREADGDLGGALDLLEEAEHLYVGDYFPDVRPIPALRARVLASQGSWVDALAWARRQGLSADDDLFYLHEYEHITLARVLLAQHTAVRDGHAIGDATRLLERLLPAADEGGRTGSVIEILVLQALAHQAQRDIPAALSCLHRALTLAEPEGFVRVFVDEGRPMALLLQAIISRDIVPSYARRVVRALRMGGPTSPVNQGLVEPLSQRELVVLQLLGTDLSGPDIARELVVSVNTVRTHTAHIFTKLGVNNRRAAVRRSVELDLLSRGRQG